MDYKEVINKWKLNKAEIARRINMPDGTFKNKISDNSVYNFTEKEAQLIIDSLRELASDIMKIDANTFDGPKKESKKTDIATKVNNLNKQVLGEKPYNPKEPKTISQNLTYLQKRQQQKLK